jgi:hypothetical protein
MHETHFATPGTSLLDARISARTLDRLVRTALRNPQRPGPIMQLVRSSAETPALSADPHPSRQRAALVRRIMGELRRWTMSRQCCADSGH